MKLPRLLDPPATIKALSAVPRDKQWFVGIMLIARPLAYGAAVAIIVGLERLML